MLEGDDSVLRDALEGFMDGLVSGESLDPDRIIEAGRARRRRRRANGAAASAATALVLLIAGGGLYALHESGYGHGNALGGADSSTATMRLSPPGTGSNTPTASAGAGTAPSTRTMPPAGTLRGTVLASGHTDGISWETSAALDGYANGNTLPQFCLYVWTSNGSTDPNTCLGPFQPDPVDPAAPTHAQVGNQVGMLPASASLAYAAIYTSQITTVKITIAGSAITLHPVTLAHGVNVVGIVMPATGGSLVGTGPGGTATATLSAILP